MAAKKTSKSSKSSQTSKARSGRGRTRVARVVEAQRDINKDFKNLTEDYGVLAARLWRIPATRYILGGVAAAAVIPFAVRALRRIPKVDHFMDENLSALSDKIEELENIVMQKIAEYTNSDSETETHAH